MVSVRDKALIPETGDVKPMRSPREEAEEERALSSAVVRPRKTSLQQTCLGARFYKSFRISK